MQERELRGLIAQVKDGKLSRRAFVRRLAAVGVAAPVAGMMLARSGVAFAQEEFTYEPAKAGGGGTLKLLMWQAPTLLNPHFSVGLKDQEGSRLFYECLAGWDSEGNLRPILAAEIPSLENGGLAADGMSVTWKLKAGVKWHDGAPFTADDCVFNWQYASDPATAAVTIGTYKDIKVEKLDELTVKVSFKRPTPFWADAFVSLAGMIIPKHLFEPYKGVNSREAPANLSPVGTGPYTFIDFTPGDLVRGKINPNYHVANRPYFDAFELKGGGDAVSAGRAVLQAGEYDFAWNLQVEDEILRKLEEGGRGRLVFIPTANVEHIQLNHTDPYTEVDGERSSLKTKHPSFSDKNVRDAMNLLVDRGSVEKFIYGRTGTATANYINNPARFVSKSTRWEFNIDKANKILDEAGWKRGADGIREKDGKKLKYVFQTFANSIRQKTQAIVKKACEAAGIAVEIKAIAPAVYASADVANPDTYTHFYADLQMYTLAMWQPDPILFVQQCVSWECATKANKWQARNISRWRNDEYDAAFRAAETELDPVKRAALFIKMNDLVIGDVAVIPVVERPWVVALRNGVKAPLSGWDSSFWQLADWYREA
jgi:peptide/nickel transport system substrate-binding protein